MPTISEVRADIDRAIEGMTLLDLFERNATRYGDKPALRWKSGDAWATMNWRSYVERAREIAAGFLSLGVAPRDFVAIMARNIPEHLIADAGSLHAAATPVSIYNTLAPDQIAYIASNCGAKVAVLENREFGKRWEEIRAKLPALEHIVMIEDADDFRFLDGVLSWNELLERGRELLSREPDAVARASAELTPDDPVTLVYTSGTTGPPKGVVITHRNACWTM